MGNQVITFLSFIILFSGCTSHITNQDYVGKYMGIFDKPPHGIQKSLNKPITAYLNRQDGPIAGNGDIGILFDGSPDSQTVFISKVDFWRARRGFPDGGPFLPGGIDIVIPELKGASYYAEQHISDGSIHEKFIRDKTGFKLSSFVPDGSNNIIFELVNEGETDLSLKLKLWSQPGNGSINREGGEDGIFWVSRSLDSKDLDWPSHISMALKIIGSDTRDFTLKPDRKVYVIIAVYSNHDSEDYTKRAINDARLSSVKSINIKRSLNDKWWKNFWNESLVEIGDTIMEKYYYGSQYILASCSRNKNFPPGMWGLFLSMDATIGDYHLNYNYQSPWWASYSSNHIGITDPYDTPILEYMPAAMQHARDILNCRGVYYPVGIGPKGFCSSMYPLTSERMMKEYGIPDNNFEGGYMFCGQRSNALFCSINMLMRFYSAYDENYAKKIYPFLVAVADFWEDYLTWEDGRYSSVNDNFYEVGPWGNPRYFRKDFENGDINPTVSLGLIRMLFKGIIDVSNFLEVDSNRHEKWNHILTHLSPIPTEFKDGIVRVRACERGMNGYSSSGTRLETGFGRVMAHALVFPAGVVGPVTDPDFTARLLREVDRWDMEDIAGDVDWDCLGNGFETFFATAARLGYDPEKVYSKLAARIPKTALRNLMIPQDGGGLETASGVPGCINEMLLQSYEGVIRVFPTWLPSRDARFTTLRAYGAFLVSSEIKKGKIPYVRIYSEKGRDCSIINPWNSTQVRIKSVNVDEIIEMNKDNRIIFKTVAGKDYLLSPI